MAEGAPPLPHYYVFDLDETLAQVYSFFYVMCTLRPDAHTQNIQPAKRNRIQVNATFQSIQPRLQSAYQHFVQSIAKRETSEHPFGLLRPGILEVFSELKMQKDAGIPLCCMIYSNNGSLDLLELVKDVIHAAVGDSELIRDCVHWYHPSRKMERAPNQPGVANKTWPILHRLLYEGPCQASVDTKPTQVTFFDDRVHPNLKRALKDQSILVQPYRYKVPVQEVNALYTDAIQSVGLLDTPESTQQLLLFIHSACGTVQEPLTWSSHLERLVTLNKGTAPEGSRPPPRLPDTDILLAAVRPKLRASTSILGVSANSANIYMGGRARIRITSRKSTRKRRGMNRKKSQHTRRR